MDINTYDSLQEVLDSQSVSESDDGLENKKRKRPYNVTCEACKQRKVKCDRAQPACGWCSRNQHVCEYKERKKPGLRAGYGRELEGRLDRLEAQLQEHARQLAAHLQHSCTLEDAQSRSVQQSAQLLPQPHNPHYDNAPLSFNGGQSTKQQMIDPQLGSADSRQHSRQFSSSHSHHLEQISVHGYDQSPSRAPSLTSPHSTMSIPPMSHNASETALLPPYDLLYTLVDLYFKHINVWLPLLDRKSTLDTLFGPSPLAEPDKIVLHAIVAVALRFCQDSRLTPENRQHYHDISKQKVQLFGLENSSVRALQALVILALDVTGNTNGPPGWNLLALISRSVIQLGLTMEATSSLTAPLYPSIATLRASVLPDARSPIEDEERRRLFWTVFMLDRYATIATAFDFALDAKEIDRRLPCRDELFSANKSADTKWFRPIQAQGYASTLVDVHGHFAYHCELLGILGRIHLFLKRPIDIGSLTDVEQWQASYRTLDSELNAWHFNLPDDYSQITRLVKSNTPAKPINCGWIMLHAAYALTVIRLNSSAAYPAQSSPIFSSSYSAMQRCLSAVDSMRQLGHLVQMSGLLDKVGPPFAFSAWVCARVCLVHSSTMDHEVDPDIELLVTLLSEMGQYWEVAKRYSEILGRVLDEYRTSQQASTNGERVTPSTVTILADMRRCAYDLDFLISRQPRTTKKSYSPVRGSTPATNQLEYLDIFDLFNFPRLPTSGEGMESGQIPGIEQATASNLPTALPVLTNLQFAQPDPESDWLFHSRTMESARSYDWSALLAGLNRGGAIPAAEPQVDHLEVGLAHEVDATCPNDDPGRLFQYLRSFSNAK